MILLRFFLLLDDYVDEAVVKLEGVSESVGHQRLARQRNQS